MRALKIADGLKSSTRRAGILTCLPVFGLRPRRWRRSRTTKDPNEESLTGPPRSRHSVISLKKSLDEHSRLDA